MSAPAPPGTALWLVGCGNMGGAMLRRWIASGVDPAGITVIDPGTPAAPEGVTVVATPPVGASPVVLVLAVKPQLLEAAAGALADAQPSLLVSILAGVEEETLARRFPGARAIVRAMPNLPVSLGRGVTALHAASADAQARATAQALMTPLGLAEWIEREDQFDAVTALSGCGPGFLFRFIDALAGAGTALGLPPAQALRLAVATVEGSALLAAASEDSPAMLADRVASPGGATREGLNVLDREQALARLLEETLAAAAAKSGAMAVAARG